MADININGNSGQINITKGKQEIESEQTKVYDENGNLIRETNKSVIKNKENNNKK